jgi:hypothetical protein
MDDLLKKFLREATERVDAMSTASPRVGCRRHNDGFLSIPDVGAVRRGVAKLREVRFPREDLSIRIER